MMLHVVNAKYRFNDGGLSREKMDFPCIYKTNLQQSLRFLGKPEMRLFCYILCAHVNIPQKNIELSGIQGNTIVGDRVQQICTQHTCTGKETF